jgi:3-phenylpropionate/trans-cinnamate dioxygenase ferredoxin reductase subunit
MSEQTFVVVGASLAGAKAAEGMREAGFEGRVVLVGDEHDQPYERPELSKGFLAGKKEAADLQVFEPGWYDEHAVELRLGTAVTGIHRDDREVELAGGERLGYDRLLLATGATPRRIEVGGAELDGVHYLRRSGDAATLRQAFSSGGRLVVVGAGWIGLEVAAAARGHDVDVTVIEPQPTPLHAVLGPEVGRLFGRLHRNHGVDLRTGTGVEGFEGSAGRVTGVVTSGGTVVPADRVVVGVGIRPNTALAEAAGLDLALGGVAVDEMLRSSDPSIWAAGDVASAFNPLFGERVRVEHWANASNQGKAAGLSMADQGEPYAKLPYFFTDQYDLGMEYHGWVGPDGYDDVVLRGDPESGEWLAFWLAGGRVLAGMTVNVWDQGDPVKAMARARTAVDRTRLADAGVPLTDLV